MTPNLHRKTKVKPASILVKESIPFIAFVTKNSSSYVKQKLVKR